MTVVRVVSRGEFRAQTTRAAGWHRWRPTDQLALWPTDTSLRCRTCGLYRSHRPHGSHWWLMRPLSVAARWLVRHTA